MAWDAILNPTPHIREFFFFASFSLLMSIWGVFLMQIVPLEAAHLFDLNTAILGWLLAALQPKKQLPRPKYDSLCRV